MAYREIEWCVHVVLMKGREKLVVIEKKKIEFQALMTVRDTMVNRVGILPQSQLHLSNFQIQANRDQTKFNCLSCGQMEMDDLSPPI